MEQVVEQFERVEEVPFTMVFMGQPQQGDQLPKASHTMTTTYSTQSGPQNSPDDGATSTKDD